MSRRFSTENIFNVYASGVAAPGTTLVSAAPGVNLSPRKIVLATPGATATVELSDGTTTFLGVQVPSTDTVCIELPEGLNLPVGSGIDMTVSGGNVAASLFYIPYDNNPGITKVASRAASLAAQNAQDATGKKATRAPNDRGLGDKS